MISIKSSERSPIQFGTPLCYPCFMTRFTCLLLFLIGLAAFADTVASVDGKWNFVAERTDDHTEALRTVLELKVVGEDVTGKLGETKLKGTYKEGKLSLVFPFAPEGADEAELKIDGGLQENAIKGDWIFGGMIAGTFKASKVSE